MLSSRSKDHLNFLNKLEEYFKNNDFINLKKGLNNLNNKLSFLTNEFKEELIFLRDNITEAIVFLKSKTDPEISKDNKKNIQEAASYSIDPLFQVTHAESLGLGSSDYRFCEL